ncbi:GtrA family protein [Segniliparus rotundus DSM 44985]|uniref:GtrA family protein n=1 Tax=Segniliparus rotundus (strain ATCC BAA-972 / CDC 1076 / CIP 108378 / DSM 44985 / JCM 13578) TaxID=640132 RepID=D6ZB66_SEGRD|nr:GtrA family protein [Segniliparus rotundus]ADG96825.1 GtrA family protein [Segniliparus rotundus DSM 44985]
MPDDSTAGLRTQALRFLVTGVFSAVVDYGLVMALSQLGAAPNAANIVGFVVGTTVAYLINRRWTFQAEPSAKRFAQVALLYTAAFLLRAGIFAGALALARSWEVSKFLAESGAWVLAQGTVTVMNFLVQRMVIFRAPARLPDAPGQASRPGGA